jgi:hypothetical protein
VDSGHLRLNLDLYHAQIGEGNLVQLVERALPLVGEIQVADVPGRCEPGTGEIHYPAVAAELERLDYTGVVALEGWACGDPEEALQWFRTAFTTGPSQRHRDRYRFPPDIGCDRLLASAAGAGRDDVPRCEPATAFHEPCRFCYPGAPVRRTLDGKCEHCHICPCQYVQTCR